MLGMHFKHSVRSLCFALGASGVVVAGCAGSATQIAPVVTNAASRTEAAASFISPDASGKNVVQNGTFDSGKLAPWRSCGKATAAISKLHPYDGKYDALTGSVTTKSEVDGWSAICQSVKVPVDGTLVAWLYRTTNEPNDKDAYQEVALADDTGKPTTVLAKGNLNHKAWEKESWAFKKYAGKTVTLFFGVYGSGRAKYYDTQFIDDVSLVGSSATPSPAPLTVKPASLTFTSASPQPLSANETDYTGSLTASSSNATVATVSPSSAKGPSATFDVTPVGGGTTTITVTGGSAPVKVSVTVDNGVIHISSTSPKPAREAN